MMAHRLAGSAVLACLASVLAGCGSDPRVAELQATANSIGMQIFGIYFGVFLLAGMTIGALGRAHDVREKLRVHEEAVNAEIGELDRKTEKIETEAGTHEEGAQAWRSRHDTIIDRCRELFHAQRKQAV